MHRSLLAEASFGYPLDDLARDAFNHPLKAVVFGVFPATGPAGVTPAVQPAAQ
jgi:hypothetical protein